MSDKQSGPAARPARRRRSRAERARENREALLNAAAEIVRESGYDGATIAEVTKRAGLSLGSFYQYFESRDDLFHQLLPAIGAKLIAVLAQETQDTTSAVEEEEKAINAYFDYVTPANPIMRVFTEAEVYAPDAYDAHMENVLGKYAKALRRQQANGDYQGFDEREIEAVALMLTYARVVFYKHYTSKEDDAWVRRAFVKIIRALSAGV